MRNPASDDPRDAFIDLCRPLFANHGEWSGDERSAAFRACQNGLMLLDGDEGRRMAEAWSVAQLERVRAAAEKYLRLVDQGGEDCGSSALKDETNDARTRLRYALKREPLPARRR